MKKNNDKLIGHCITSPALNSFSRLSRSLGTRRDMTFFAIGRCVVGIMAGKRKMENNHGTITISPCPHGTFSPDCPARAVTLLEVLPLEAVEPSLLVAGGAWRWEMRCSLRVADSLWLPVGVQSPLGGERGPESIIINHFEQIPPLTQSVHFHS